jgi:hypothetical protein
VFGVAGSGTCTSVRVPRSLELLGRPSPVFPATRRAARSANAGIHDPALSPCSMDPGLRRGDGDEALTGKISPSGSPRPSALAEHCAGGRPAQGPATPAAQRRPAGPSLTRATARAPIPSRPKGGCGQGCSASFLPGLPGRGTTRSVVEGRRCRGLFFQRRMPSAGGISPPPRVARSPSPRCGEDWVHWRK